MALREGAALEVLAGKTDRIALEQDRAESQRLGRRPVDALARFDRRAPVSRKRLMVLWTSKSFGTSVSFLPISFSVFSGTAVLPRRSSSWSSAFLRPDQAPSSQSALLGL